MARQMTAQTDPFVDPAALAADVFNVDFSLTSADALIAQLESAVSLDDEKKTSRLAATQEKCVCRTPTRLPNDASPFATASVVAQVLQESVAQLAQVEPLEAVRDDGCDYQTILMQVTSSATAIAKELSKPEPFADRVNFHLTALTGFELEEEAVDLGSAGDLALLRKRLGVDGAACSVKDERTRSAFSSAVQFTFMARQAWQKALAARPGSLAAAMPSLQRSLRGIVLAGDELRQAVPSSAWLTYEIQSDPPIVAWDLYQWIHDEASAGALNDLKQGGRDGIGKVNAKMTRIKELVDSTLRVTVGDEDEADPCKAAFRNKKVQAIVGELICLMEQVITVTNKLRPQSSPPE